MYTLHRLLPRATYIHLHWDVLVWKRPGMVCLTWIEMGTMTVSEHIYFKRRLLRLTVARGYDWTVLGAGYLILTLVGEAV